MPVQYPCTCYLLAEYRLVTNFVVYMINWHFKRMKILTHFMNAGQRHFTNTSLVDLIRTMDLLYFNQLACQLNLRSRKFWNIWNNTTNICIVVKSTFYSSNYENKRPSILMQKFSGCMQPNYIGLKNDEWPTFEKTNRICN